MVARSKFLSQEECMKPRYWHGEKILDLLNNRVYPTAEGETRIRTPQERNKRDANASCGREFIFVRDVDILVKGYCTLEEQRDDRKRFYGTIGGLKPMSVVMLGTCCTVYSEEFQSAVRKQFPATMWFFPDMTGLTHDFGSDEGIVQTARCLMEAGIIAIADNDSFVSVDKVITPCPGLSGRVFLLSCESEAGYNNEVWMR